MRVGTISSRMRAVLAGAVIGLSACGGGGDAPPQAAPVTVGTPRISSILATVLVGDTMYPVQVDGTLSGDLASLNGRTVYVIVEDPAGLFIATPPPTVVVQQVAGTYHYALNLQGQVMRTVGRRTGTLRIFVCLDPACGSPLGGTPISLPFDVNVIPGLTVTPKNVSVSVQAGTVPPDQVVSVAVTDYSLSRAWVATDANAPNPNSKMTIVDEGLLRANDQLTFRLAAAPPGVYRERIRVRTTALIGPAMTLEFNEFVDITYTVTP